jgi:uncharacterized repeat protein (TIGR03803 family)
MKSWLFHALRNQQRRRAHRGAFPSAGRSPRFERLEDRQMLAATVETIHSFDSPTSYSAPTPGLTVDGSKVFGTTNTGGSDNDGVLYSMNADGSDYQILHTFTGSATDGANPVGTLTLDGSTLYGTTGGGGSGSNGYGGTIFSINVDGTGFQLLHSFGNTFNDGEQPETGLTLSGSTLYGTTFSGESNEGTVFSINTDGSGYQVIHQFSGPPGIGFWPSAPLTVAGSTIYGTTSLGGANDDGTIFSVNADGGDFQTLHSFNLYAGGNTNAGLGLTLIGSTLYGTTTSSAGSEDGTIFSIQTNGSDYQTLHTFDQGVDDGIDMAPDLTLVGSTLFGATEYGGTGDGGTLFSINPDGSDFQTLYSFAATGSSAAYNYGPAPVSPLTLDGSILLGITHTGGTAGDGTIFSVSGLVPNPTVSASNGVPSFALGSPAVAVDAGLMVGSVDADLTGASVTISPGTLQPGDTLNFTGQNGISGSYSGGVLTLSGSATPAQYQAALESVTFSATSTNATTRSISIVVDDGNTTSNTAAEQMAIATPLVTPSGTTNTFLIGGSAVAVDSGIVVGYGKPDLTGFTMTISAGTYQPGDALNFTNQNGISGSYAGGVLKLSGTATVADYQAALQSVTFSTTSTVTGTRAITIVGMDGSLDGGSAAESVDVALPTPVLSVPFSNITGYTANYSVGTSQIIGANLTAVGSTLFGTAGMGYSGGNGVIFSVNPDGTGLTILHSFTGTDGDGANPMSSMTLVGSTLIGTTEHGGAYGDGTIFSINTDGSGYQVLHSFGATKTEAQDPLAGLTLDGSILFGTTIAGGSAGEGTVFSIHTDGTGFQVLHSFAGTDANAQDYISGLTLDGSTLYGTTANGGYGLGSVYSIHTDGSNYQVLHSFTEPVDEEGYPEAELTLVGSTLFGTTQSGGADGRGSIFSINTDGSDYQVVYSFADGGDPAGLTLVGSTLYGTTEYGGNDDAGTLFSIETDGTGFQQLYSFNFNTNGGYEPETGLVLLGTTLYGSTGIDFLSQGGLFSISDVTNYSAGGPAAAFDAGLTVTLTPNSTDLTGAAVTISPGTFQSGDLLNFSNQNGITGSYAGGVLTLSGNATAAQYQAALHSVTFSSTSANLADPAISTVTFDAAGTQASNAVWEQIIVGAPLVTASGGTATFTIGGAAVAIDAGLTVNSADTDLTGATVTISSGTLQPGDMLHFTNQNGISGSYTGGVLTLSGTATVAQYQAALQSITFSTGGADTGTLIGTRAISIVAIDGSLESDPAAESVAVTVFGSAVTLTTLQSLDAPIDYREQSGLTVDGSLVFGTTDTGGSDNDGVVFSMHADGSDYQVLHTFTGLAGDGATPVGNLTLVGSTLFGVTTAGGSGSGTIFSINTDGTGYQVLHTFSYATADGAEPEAGLTLSGTTLYGTTEAGAWIGGGTIYSINVDGSGYTTICSFSPGDRQGGFWPSGPLTVSGSTIYGTTSGGGTNDDGTIFSVNTDGSDFQTLYSFNLYAGGNTTNGIALTLVGSTLYGTTTSSAGSENGTIFSIHTDGSDYQTLHTFGVTAGDGYSPVQGLTLVGSTLYGATTNGGTGGWGNGTVFSIHTDGSGYQTLYSLSQTTTGPEYPNSPLTLEGTTLLGMTYGGGRGGTGTIYSLSGLTPKLFVSASNGSPVYAQGGPAVAVDAGLLVGSVDADLTGATVTVLPGTLQPGDVLNFTNQNGISGSYADGVLTLSGSATSAEYQAALQSVTFSTTSTVTSTRSISIVALDGGESSNAAAEQMTIAGPLLTASGTTNTVFTGGLPVVVDSGILVSGDVPELTGATVTISPGTFQPGDTLNVNAGVWFAITSSYNSTTGVLTLSGSATPLQYQYALESIQFSTTSTVLGARAISIVAVDGPLTSNSLAESVDVAIGPPVLTGSGVIGTYTIGEAAVAIDSGLTLTSMDTDLTGATVTISSGTLQTGDTLSFTNQNGITGGYLGGVLTLTGRATPAQYQAALESVTFSTTSTTLGMRQVLFVASDGAENSDCVAENVKVTSATVGPPVVTPSGTTSTFKIGETNTWNEPGVTVDSGITVSSSDADLTGATVTISPGTLEPGDTLSLYNQVFYTSPILPYSGITLASSIIGSPVGIVEPNGSLPFSIGGISASYFDGVLTLNGDATPAQYQQALQLITFSTTSTVAGTRSLSIVVYDGSLASNPAAESVNVAASTAGPPVVTPSGVTGIYTIGGAAVAIDSGLTVSSADTDLTGATVTISPGTLEPGDTLSLPGQFVVGFPVLPYSGVTPASSNVIENPIGIVGPIGVTFPIDINWNPGITASYSDGVLTLSGDATPAQYQQALQSITFSTTSTVAGTRSLSIVVYDGSLASNAAAESVDVVDAQSSSPQRLRDNCPPAPIHWFVEPANPAPIDTPVTPPITVLPVGQHGVHAFAATATSLSEGEPVEELLASSGASSPAATSVADLALAVQESGPTSLTAGSSTSSITTSAVGNVASTSVTSTIVTSASTAATSSVAAASSGSSTALAATKTTQIQAIDEAVSDFDLTDLYV